MPDITVWTKQNIAVLDQLASNGRFIADGRYIRRELESTTDIMLLIYRWLAKHVPTAHIRPSDAEYLVWVSLSEESTMMPEPGYVVLELSVDESLIAFLDTAKWTRITNYSYIPLNKEDEEAHNEILQGMGINNAEAVMTQFYPQMRDKIIKSWDRLFDDSICLGSTTQYGVIWEVREEWLQKITK